MKLQLDSDFLRYIDSIFNQCTQKAAIIGIHSDSEKIIFFIPIDQLRLEFLNDIRIAKKYQTDNKFTIGLEYNIFSKLLIKKGIIDFNIGKTHVDIKTENSKHRFKIIEIEYESIVPLPGGYEIFTTDLSVPLSHIFKPKYDPKLSGAFVNDINFRLSEQSIFVTSTDRSVLTKYIWKITTNIKFEETIFSLPSNTLNFMLLTMKDINIVKIFVTQNEFQILILDPKFESTLKYNLKLSSVEFPNCDKLLIHGEDTFTVLSDKLIDFFNEFISIKNEDLKEIISLQIVDNKLECSLIHKEHNSVSLLEIEPKNIHDALSYFDLNAIKDVIKNSPKSKILSVGLFVNKMFITTDNYQALIGAIAPETMSNANGKSNTD